jgi:hypothetical protein
VISEETRSQYPYRKREAGGEGRRSRREEKEKGGAEGKLARNFCMLSLSPMSKVLKVVLQVLSMQ